MGPCIAYTLCSRVASVDVVVPAPAVLCFAPLSIVTASKSRLLSLETEKEHCVSGSTTRSFWSCGPFYLEIGHLCCLPASPCSWAEHLSLILLTDGFINDKASRKTFF